MSKRMIHSNITTSEKFSSISFEAEVLYVRLLIFTDDYGNTRGTTGFVKDICFPKDKTKPLTYKEVDKLIKELIKVELIVPYQVDNILYLHFNRFEDFQELRKDRLRKTDIPYYDCSLSIARQLPVKCPHEVEVEVEVEVEEKEEDISAINKINSLEKLEAWNFLEDNGFKSWLDGKYESIASQHKSKFNKDFLLGKKEELILSCKSKGYKYKDYKSTLQNWINRDIKGWVNAL